MLTTPTKARAMAWTAAMSAGILLLTACGSSPKSV